jgi:hypothetical protein
MVLKGTAAARRRKFQTSNSKSQTQSTNDPNTLPGLARLEFGILGLEISLEFGAWDLKFAATLGARRAHGRTLAMWRREFAGEA